MSTQDNFSALLEVLGFTKHKSVYTKSIGQSNINATVMKNIKEPVPSLVEQKQFVAKVEALEKQIAEAQAIIDGATARKEAVMKKYL
jgi:restriction endonuclease S subunit